MTDPETAVDGADPDGDVDYAALRSYLADALDDDVTDIRVLSDKLNLILALSTTERDPAYVLRRPLKLRHTDLFNPLTAEYGLLKRLDETEIPTQSPVLFCADSSVLGEQFLVARYLDGEPVPLGTDLPERFQTPAARRSVAREIVDTLADVHSLDTSRFEDVCDHRSPGEQLARETKRLDAATAVTGRELPQLRAVGEWLRDNVPPSSASPTALVHGDYRPGNLLFAGEETPELTGVIDWESATLGDPLTELGYLLLRWRDEGDPRPSLDELDAFDSLDSNSETAEWLRAANDHGLSPFTSRPGSPSRRELVARYEEQTGFAFENERFHRAHAAFSLATVWEDLRRHDIEAGADPDPNPWVDYMAAVAASIVDGEFPL